MLYLIWGLINLALIIAFIGVCFSAAKLLKNNISKAAASLFVFGLISFASRPGDNNSNPVLVMNDQVVPDVSTRQVIHGSDKIRHVEIVLQDNLISKYTVDVMYKVDAPENVNIPHSAYSRVLGVIGGTGWKPMRIEVQRTANNKKFEYSVYGGISWNLLGLQIAHQDKLFEGFVNLK